MALKTENVNTVGGKKQFFQNIFIVLISNIFSMVSGVLVGFIIPKIMGVSEYGYYKTFTLYCSYIGVLHFGFIDGIYLKFAGKKFEDLDKEKFRTYTKFLFIMETAMMLLVVFCSLLFLNVGYFLIIFCVAINILATNVITYFEFISQITMKFKRMTMRNVIRCSLNIFFVLFLFVLYNYNNIIIYNYYYVAITLSVNYVLAIWYVISYRDITFGRSYTLRESKGELIGFFKVGIPLLLSNLIVQLIFIVDQQFVNLAFDIDTYSVYAFAYNMINLITIATSAISTVLYPTLSKVREDSVESKYSKINSYLLMFVALCLSVYYPLIFIVNNFLPNYSQSLNIFLIIVPGILISSSISVVKYNFYKIFGQVNKYFIISLIVLFLAVLADIIVYLIFKNTKSISMVSIIVLFIWYIVAELYFVKIYKVKWIRNLTYLVFAMTGFYAISIIPNIYLGFLFYLLYYGLITGCIYFNEIKGVILKLKLKKTSVVK